MVFLDEDALFTRTLEIESRDGTLTFYQQKQGDVSCVVWDAALVLAKYLDRCCQDDRFGANWLKDKTIVELGSGVGCVGITAACLGAKVICTDLPDTLEILEKNIESNREQYTSSGGSVHAEVLKWGTEISPHLSGDIIVLADCVYYTESIEPLLNTLEALCKRKPEAYAIFSQEERDTPGQVHIWQLFLEKLKEKFNVAPIPLSEQHPTYSSRDIHLMKLSVLER